MTENTTRTDTPAEQALEAAVDHCISVLADSFEACELWPGFQCLEIEALVEVFRARGAHQLAEEMIAAHATGDDSGDLHGRPDTD